MLASFALSMVLDYPPTPPGVQVALDCRVGHFSDPKAVPGLAHFCEHMLFLGTEKYPKEGEYKEFLHRHGGRSNAYTAQEHTNYKFDVAADHLEPAMDRFADFFKVAAMSHACHFPQRCPNHVTFCVTWGSRMLHMYISTGTAGGLPEGH